MKYKYLFCDLDGTLLNSKNEISENDLNTIALAREGGLKFIVATGRSTSFCKSHLKNLGVLGNRDEIIIASTGTLICNGMLQPIFKKPLLEQHLCLAMEYIEKYGCETMFSSINKNYFMGPIEKLTIFNGGVFEDCEHVKPGEFREIIKHEEIYKIMTFADKETIKIIEDWYLPATNYETEIASTTSGAVEFNYKKTQDDKGLLDFCKIYNCLPEEIIAIGDSITDKGMLLAAGLGACPSNAKEEILEIADYVCKASNENSCVSEVLKKFVL